MFIIVFRNRLLFETNLFYGSDEVILFKIHMLLQTWRCIKWKNYQVSLCITMMINRKLYRGRMCCVLILNWIPKSLTRRYYAGGLSTHGGS